MSFCIRACHCAHLISCWRLTAKPVARTLLLPTKHVELLVELATFAGCCSVLTYIPLCNTGYRQACEAAKERLELLALNHSSDEETFRQDLLNIAKTTLRCGTCSLITLVVLLNPHFDTFM